MLSSQLRPVQIIDKLHKKAVSTATGGLINSGDDDDGEGEKYFIDILIEKVTGLQSSGKILYFNWKRGNNSGMTKTAFTNQYTEEDQEKVLGLNREEALGDLLSESSETNCWATWNEGTTISFSCKKSQNKELTLTLIEDGGKKGAKELGKLSLDISKYFNSTSPTRVTENLKRKKELLPIKATFTVQCYNPNAKTEDKLRARSLTLESPMEIPLPTNSSSSSLFNSPTKNKSGSSKSPHVNPTEKKSREKDKEKGSNLRRSFKSSTSSASTAALVVGVTDTTPKPTGLSTHEEMKKRGHRRVKSDATAARSEKKAHSQRTDKRLGPLNLDIVSESPPPPITSPVLPEPEEIITQKSSHQSPHHTKTSIRSQSESESEHSKSTDDLGSERKGGEVEHLVSTIENQERELIQLKNQLAEKQTKEDQQFLYSWIFSLKEPVYSSGTPVVGYIMFRSMIHWRVFDPSNKKLLDHILGKMNQIATTDECKISMIVYWLGTTSVIINLLKKEIQILSTSSSDNSYSHCLSQLRNTVQRLFNILVKKITDSLVSVISPGLGSDNLLIESILKQPNIMQMGEKPKHTVSEVIAILEEYYKIFDEQNKKSSIFHTPTGALGGKGGRKEVRETGLMDQLYRQVFYFINCVTCTRLLTSPEMCTCGNGFQIKISICSLQDWASKVGLHDASEELQIMKQLSDALVLDKTSLTEEAVRSDVCPLLSLPLLRQMLSQYTPDEFDPNPVKSEVKNYFIRRNESFQNWILDESYIYPINTDLDQLVVNVKNVYVPEQLLEVPTLGFLQNSLFSCASISASDIPW